MERATTPPQSGRNPSQAKSPPTPEVMRKIVSFRLARILAATATDNVFQEENRLKAKAIRDRREAEQRAAGTTPSIPKTSSGFVPTDSVRITKPVNGKRTISEIEGLRTNRDGRDRGDENELRPAPKFAKFVDYNMSSMTDTKGGFLSTEDDPNSLGPKKGPDDPQRPKDMTVQEWERQQLLRNLKRQKVGPYEPGLTILQDDDKRKRCRECRSFEIDFVWEEVFHICICSKCKDKFPDKYSLLTKTECKEDYLLTDRYAMLYIIQFDTNRCTAELRDPDLLPHLSKPNPHKSHWHDMMLFLRFQVEEYAIKTKWGSSEALDAEYERRETQKKARKERQFKEKLLDLKRKTRTDAFRRQAGNLGKTGANKF
ncbi:hypothetical protein Golomagni_07806, partial [Golovinomyces magnicellulatus]